MTSELPKLQRVKAQYHAGSDTHYVLGWFLGGANDDNLPDLSIKVEKSGAYLGDSDTREEIALHLVGSLKDLFPNGEADDTASA